MTGFFMQYLHGFKYYSDIKNTHYLAIAGISGGEGDGADRRQWRTKEGEGRESYERTRGASARRCTRR